MTAAAAAPPPVPVADLLGERLERYAERGVFRGMGPLRARGGAISFRIVWHRGRTHEVVADPARATLRFSDVLPAVPARSEMYRELRRFVASRQSRERPEHRRLDPAKVRARCANRAGEVSIVLEVLDGDWDYASRKIVHLVDEVLQVFLSDGRWYEYMIEHLGLDPDRE